MQIIGNLHTPALPVNILSPKVDAGIAMSSNTPSLRHLEVNFQGPFVEKDWRLISLDFIPLYKCRSGQMEYKKGQLKFHLRGDAYPYHPKSIRSVCIVIMIDLNSLLEIIYSSALLSSG